MTRRWPKRDWHGGRIPLESTQNLTYHIAGMFPAGWLTFWQHTTSRSSPNTMHSFPNTKLSNNTRTYVNHESYLRRLHEHTAYQADCKYWALAVRRIFSVDSFNYNRCRYHTSSVLRAWAQRAWAQPRRTPRRSAPCKPCFIFCYMLHTRLRVVLVANSSCTWYFLVVYIGRKL